MRDLIRKVLNEHINESNKLEPSVKEFLLNYWEKNGTELTPFKYLNIDPWNHEKEIDALKVKFHGGFYKAYELAEKEVGIGETIHISDGGYEFDMTPLSVGIISMNTKTPDENPYGVEIGASVRITNGSVQLLNNDDNYRWDLFDLFHRDNDISSDDLYEITMEISDTCKEYFHDIFEKYGLSFSTLRHTYSDSWRKE